MAVFALVHSPSVGPATWQPVARLLAGAGHQAVVPSLLGVGDGPPPYWRRVLSTVSGWLAAAVPGQPVVLVAHSNAGVFVPVLVDGLPQPVESCIFADATVPAIDGASTPMAPAEFLPFLQERAEADGRLPQWSRWWDEADTAALFPDPQTRQLITAQEPRLPLAYYYEDVPAPPGWAGRPCAFLQFSAGYEEPASQARSLGWPVRTVPGQHLHQVVDPAAVATALVDLAGQPRQ
jgi:hypothetical protein